MMACGAGSDHTSAGERREDTGSGAASTGGTAGAEEAVSDPTQAKRRLEWGTRRRLDEYSQQQVIDENRRFLGIKDESSK